MENNFPKLSKRTIQDLIQKIKQCLIICTKSQTGTKVHSMMHQFKHKQQINYYSKIKYIKQIDYNTHAIIIITFFYILKLKGVKEGTGEFHLKNPSFGGVTFPKTETDMVNSA